MDRLVDLVERFLNNVTMICHCEQNVKIFRKRTTRPKKNLLCRSHYKGWAGKRLSRGRGSLGRKRGRQS